MNFDLNIRHLEYFIATAHAGSINKAAQTLFISQPYLGKIITELEHRLGTVLMQRTRSGIILTPDGNKFLMHAEAIVRESRHLEQDFRNVPETASPLIVSTTKFSHIMNSFLEIVEHHAGEPSFSHQLKEGSTEDVIDDVFSGQSKIGIIHFDSQRSGELKKSLSAKGLSYRFITYCQPHIIISRDHPLLKQERPIRLEDLEGYGLARYTGHYEDFIYHLVQNNQSYNLNLSKKIVYLSDRASLLNLIAESDFYSIGIHDFAGQESVYNILSVPIDHCTSTLEFGSITASDTKIGEMAEEFLDNVTKKLRSL